MDWTSIGEFAAGGAATAVVLKLFARGFETRIAQDKSLLDHLQSMNDKMLDSFLHGNGRGSGGLAAVEAKVDEIYAKVGELNAKLDEHGDVLKDLPCMSQHNCTGSPDDPS